MSTPSEKPTSTNDKGTHEVVTDINEKLETPAANTGDTVEPSQKSSSLLHSVSEIGKDAASKLKDVIAEIDTDELKQKLNTDKVKRSLASTMDGLNTKVQKLLASDDEGVNAADTKPKAEDKL